MLISILSLIVAILIFLYPEFYAAEPNYIFLALLTAIGGTAFLIVLPIFNSIMLIPFNQLQQKLASRLMEIVRKDKPLLISQTLQYLFPFLSYALAAALLLINIPHKMLFFAVWIFLLGVNLDLMRDVWKRSVNFLNPYHLLGVINREAKKAIEDEHDDTLWKSIDAVAEMNVQAIERSKIALGTQALNTFPTILHNFFISSKSIVRVNQDEKVERQTGLDEATFTVFYILQRLELIFSKALDHGLETICSAMMTVLGKIILYSAQYDLSMVTYPAHYLGKFAVAAQARNFDEVVNIAISTLLEVSKTILNTVDLSFAELEQPFQTIVNDLDIIAKSIFKKDKNTSIQVLVQPLRDLKAMFQTEKMANHQDTPTVIQNIDRVLAEFDALEQVLRTIPPIPDLDIPSTSQA